MRKICLCTLAASLLPFPTIAAAASSLQAVTIRVPYGDLDIAKPQDAAILKRRIARAVGRACRRPSMLTSDAGVMDEKCRTDALAAALAVMERRRAVQVAARD
jgi:UrcA family protein